MKKRFFIIILTLLCFGLYFNSLSNSFVYDDFFVIVNNSYIKYFKEALPSFFNTKFFQITYENTYRPIATLTYYINYQIWKLDPLGYHLFNVLNHIGNVLLLFVLLNKLFKNKITSFVICLLYLSHPILTEAVNCPAFNEDLLVTLFYILAFIFYLKFIELKKTKSSFYLLSLIFLFLCLLSKEMGITFIGMIIFYDIFVREKELKKEIKKESPTFKNFISDSINTINKEKFVYIGYLIVTLFYLYLLFILFKNPLGTSQIELSREGIFTRIIYIPYIFLMHLKLTLIPINLNVVHKFSYPSNFFSLINIFSYIIFAGTIFLTYFTYKRSKKIFFGLSWFLITIIPVLNIIKNYDPFAERFLYLPAIGICIVIGTILTDLFDKIELKNKIQKNTIQIILILCLFSFYSYSTIQRNFVWNNELTLWSDSLKKSPDNSKANIALAAAYLSINMSNPEEIKTLLNKAIESDKSDNTLSAANYYLGILYTKELKYDDAVAAFDNSIKFNNTYDKAYFEAGKVYTKKEDYDKAIEMYKKSIKYNPRNLDARLDLGKLYILIGDYNEAQKLLEQSLKFDPNNSNYYYYLGTSYENQNKLTDALAAYKKATELSPNVPYAYSKCGQIYARLNLFEQAKKSLIKAIELDPSLPDSYFNLGMVYAGQNKLKDAIIQWEKTLSLDPNFKAARDNIVYAKKMMK